MRLRLFYVYLSLSVVYIMVYLAYLMWDTRTVAKDSGNLRRMDIFMTSQGTDRAPSSRKADEDMIGSNEYTKMKFEYIYILGVAGGNSSDDDSWDIFKIYASVGRHFLRETNISCCFKYTTDSNVEILKAPTISIQQVYDRAFFTAVHYTCNNPKEGIVPNGVGLTGGRFSCKEMFVNYVGPFLPQKELGTTLVLSTKAAYGNVSAEQIIEWMETYAYLGADKIVTHYLNDINRDALAVLKYYASSNILDLHYHEPAAPDIYPRKFDNNEVQFCNDKQMIVYDSFEKMSGHTYFGVIDHDEFLIPSRNRSLKQMLADLYQKYDKAAGFIFKSQYYYLSWGPSGDVNSLMLGTYVNRTSSGPQRDQEKLIFKTNRAQSGTVHTHKIIPKEGFHMQVVPSEEGFIRHYRPCRKNKISNTKENNCLYRVRRVTDTSVAEWSQRIRENVERVREKVFGTKNKGF